MSGPPCIHLQLLLSSLIDRVEIVSAVPVHRDLGEGRAMRSCGGGGRNLRDCIHGLFGEFVACC